jgi:hypothetical protein
MLLIPHAKIAKLPSRRGEASAAGRRALCLRPKPRSRRQGAGETPTSAQVAVEAARGVRRHEDHPRGTVDEARWRARQRTGGMAIDPCRGGCGQRHLQLRTQLQEATSSTPARGRYLLRTNLTDADPARLWNYYLQLVAVEEAFKNLKGDLAIRPIFHQEWTRIEAHILVCSSDCSAFGRVADGGVGTRRADLA